MLEADLVVSATEVACTLTVAGFGGVAGAVYVTDVAPALVSVPHVLAEHPAPLSDQVTPRFCESFCTVAVKVMAWET